MLFVGKTPRRSLLKDIWSVCIFLFLETWLHNYVNISKFTMKLIIQWFRSCSNFFYQIFSIKSWRFLTRLPQNSYACGPISPFETSLENSLRTFLKKQYSPHTARYRTPPPPLANCSPLLTSETSAPKLCQVFEPVLGKNKINDRFFCAAEISSTPGPDLRASRPWDANLLKRDLRAVLMRMSPIKRRLHARHVR